MHSRQMHGGASSDSLPHFVFKPKGASSRGLRMESETDRPPMR